jgi:capsular exopolysaccharide synthesis family protein
MREALLDLTSQRDQAASQIDVLRQGLTGAKYEALAEVLQTEAASELEKQRQALLVSLADQESGSPASIKLEQALAKVQTSLGEAATFRLAELETSVTSSETEMDRARRELSAAIFRADLPADTLAQIYELQQTSQNATATYQTLLARLHNLETQSSLQIADSRVVSPALSPTDPSFPKIPLVLGGASLLALAMGVGVGFVFENFVGGFTSGDQVEMVTQQPLTATLPRQRMDANSPSVADTMVNSPLSLYAENVRRLRTSLDRSLSVRGGRDTPGKASVILVSSALPGEGKTTVALSLARTYALAGRKVLIVDGDLRKPSLHKHLELEPSTSLVDFLTGALPREEFRKVVVTDRKTSLTAVLGARRSDVPTDQLLTKASFSELLAVAGRMFDFIIIDSPPIEAVVDGLYLAGYADAVVFVIHWAKTPQRAAVKVLKSLRATMTANADVLLVMNQEIARPGASRSGYSGYYSG